MVLDKCKKILFLTGTRADFGKLKSLMKRLQGSDRFEIHIFVTGMHMLSKYGYTCEEVEKANFPNIYKYINQNCNDSMDHVLAKTITGLSDYVREISPDLLIVHGDRVEALAGASVGALNNILTGHIEGGEISGTIDEMIRHAVTKMSHIHFVSNNEAKNRLIQLGEKEKSIFVIGSPDIDLMNSSLLPKIEDVKERYGIDYDEYSVFLFHPVTTELSDLRSQIKIVVNELIKSNKNYIVIYPNNDSGTDLIINEYDKLKSNNRFKIYPSMRFEYFLTLLKHAEFIVGNSSAGVREAPHFGIPTINIGTRQNNRVNCESVVNIDIEQSLICDAINNIQNISCSPLSLFGDGNSDKLFYSILRSPDFWVTDKQKYFIDQEMNSLNNLVTSV